MQCANPAAANRLYIPSLPLVGVILLRLRLAILHRLLLSRVPIRQLPRLSLVLLLHLLGPGIAGLLLSQPLMLSVLFLLEALAFLILLGNQIVLLLLVLLVCLGVSRVRRLGTLIRGKVIWMYSRPGRSVV